MQINPLTNTLSQHQTENPGLVFYELFDYASLPQLKEHLWQWLKLTVTGGYSKKYFNYRDRDNILTLYEHLEKLLEACHVVYSDRKEELRKQYRLLQEEEFKEE